MYCDLQRNTDMRSVQLPLQFGLRSYLYAEVLPHDDRPPVQANLLHPELFQVSG